MGNCCCPAKSEDDDDNKGQVLDQPLLPDSEHNSKITIESFELLKVLGEGSFGKVYLVEKRDTKHVYAMKVLKKANVEKRNQRFHTKTEREILAKIESPFIVKLHYAFQTKDKLYLVVDFLPGGELFTHLHMAGIFDEPRAKFYAAELLLALECLHKRDIIYRDMKPENILLDADGHLRLTDFGLSKGGVKYGSREKAYTRCGTPEYLAPEILQDLGHDQAVDFWSYGALIYEMLSGRPPFYHKERNQMFKLILEPNERLKKADEIKRHEFFRGIDWVQLENKTIKPPFRPKLRGNCDVRFFDKEFTEKMPLASPAFQSSAAAGTYTGFTYDPQNLSDHSIKDKKAVPVIKENELIEINHNFLLLNSNQ